LNLIEKLLHLSKADIAKAIVARAGFDIAVLASEIALGAGIKPQGFNGG
jgi:hypothetical protein